eukprot:g8881.t1
MDEPFHLLYQEIQNRMPLAGSKECLQSHYWGCRFGVPDTEDSKQQCIESYWSHLRNLTVAIPKDRLDEIPRLWLKPIMMFHILVLCWQLASAFEVLDVGAPRTGTQSLHTALNLLGYKTLHSGLAVACRKPCVLAVMAMLNRKRQRSSDLLGPLLYRILHPEAHDEENALRLSHLAHITDDPEHADKLARHEDCGQLMERCWRTVGSQHFTAHDEAISILVNLLTPQDQRGAILKGFAELVQRQTCRQLLVHEDMPILAHHIVKAIGSDVMWKAQQDLPRKKFAQHWLKFLAMQLPEASALPAQALGNTLQIKDGTFCHTLLQGSLFEHVVSNLVMGLTHSKPEPNRAAMCTTRQLLKRHELAERLATHPRFATLVSLAISHLRLSSQELFEPLRALIMFLENEFTKRIVLSGSHVMQIIDHISHWGADTNERRL